MEIHLFAGVAVSEFDEAVTWFERLLGERPSFRPHSTEAVWILAEHRAVYVLLAPERAGGGLVTLMVDDLAGFVSAAAGRGVEPDLDETYDNGVRKVTYRDPDGNEVGVGQVP